MSSKLKAVRAGHRSTVTKLFKKINVEDSTEVKDIQEIESVITLIKKKQTILADLDKIILDQTSEDDIEDEIEEADRYVLEIESKLARITKRLCTITSSYHSPSNVNVSVLNPNATEFQHSNPYQSSFSSSSTSSSQYHKLPKLSLPTFDGNLLNWQSFWDSFFRAIHNNSILSDVQKFNYLRSQLHGEAVQSISGLQVTEANYALAVAILKKRFGQQHKIINAYMQGLINIQAPSNNLHSIKLFYDIMESHIRGLDSMGHYQNSYGSLLIPILINKLPRFVRQNMTREHGNDDWDLPSIRIGLQREICILEAGNSLDTHVDLLPPTAVFFTGTKPRRQFKQTPKQDLFNKPCVF
ncbi:uncharacterized protein LOC117331136 [Pecten maximus]|uniref:uncharacterized protein LOC117331136 n=1 Tax=Pecten maximus TaxID=6579 RepID=UPI00145866F4|nr:uncharacterized protein LOC117331136 [Pecten maximus]